MHLPEKEILVRHLKVILKELKSLEKKKQIVDLGLISIAIADVYSIMGNHNNAVYYYKKAIAIHTKNDDHRRFINST